ncbi:M1 family aminopeptidase [soil metagenome]
MRSFFLIISLIIFLNSYNTSFAQPPSVNERQRTYDVKHISLNIGFDWNTKGIDGNCTTTIIPITKLSEFEVDAVNFDITSIIDEAGNALKYDYDKKTIKIFLSREYNSSEKIIYTVDYVCHPERGIYFRYPSELNPSMPHEVWTQGEDMDNRYYIPCYDYPNDKTTSEMYIRIDKNYKTLSNGYLESSKDFSTSERIDHWVQDKPHSTYLMMIGAGEYEILKDSYNGIPILNYVSYDRVEDGKYAFRNTPEMMKAYNKFFSYDYPWAKLGQIVISDFIVGGMENTSAITYNERVYYPKLTEKDYGGDNLISHEFTHQWWGDLITCRNWDELWLNESFATFGTALWKEYKYGKDEYDYDLLDNSDNAKRSDSVSGAYPVWAGYKSVTAKVYDKGSVMINFFRDVLGEKFFDGLSTFLHDNEFANVETMDLEQAFDKASPGPDHFGNADHKWMFEDYIWKGGFPVFRVKYNFDAVSQNLNLKVDQIQKSDTLYPTVFRAPVNIRIYSSGESRNERVWIGKLSEEYNFKILNAPEYVEFDAGNKIHDLTIYDRSRGDCINQILHSADAIDRILAIRELPDHPYDRIIPEVLKNVLQNDKFWGARVEAAKALGKVPRLAHKILLDQLKNEKDSRIITAIFTALGKFKDRNDVKTIKDYIEKEKNEYIVREGLKTMVALSMPEEIKAIILPYASVRSHRNIIMSEVLAGFKKLEESGNDQEIRNAIIGIAYGKDVDYRLRESAILRLMKYAEDKDVKELSMKYIDYNVTSTQKAIFNLLGNSKDSRVKDYLITYRDNNKNSQLTKSLNDAIDKLNQ